LEAKENHDLESPGPDGPGNIFGRASDLSGAMEKPIRNSLLFVCLGDGEFTVIFLRIPGLRPGGRDKKSTEFVFFTVMTSTWFGIFEYIPSIFYANFKMPFSIRAKDAETFTEDIPGP
jgi:hypothetical protein